MTSATPSKTLNVLVFAAALRKESLNERLASLAARIARQLGANVDLASMRDFDVPLYDGDVEARGMPAGACTLREKLLANDAFILASPEYNGSMPGIIKNLIDWTSRFRPQPFDGKHGLLLSASPSLAGGNRGLWSLRMPLEHLGARMFPDMFSLAMAHRRSTATRSPTQHCMRASRRTCRHSCRSPRQRSTTRASSVHGSSSSASRLAREPIVSIRSLADPYGQRGERDGLAVACVGWYLGGPA